MESAECKNIWRCGYRIGIFFGILIGVLLMYAKTAYGLELSCGQELNVIAFNQTDNTTYNVSIKSTCAVNRAITLNSTNNNYVNDTLNLAVICNQDYEPQQICAINTTLGSNTTLINTEGSCNVQVTTSEFNRSRCSFNAIFRTQLDTNFTYENNTEPCDLNFTIEGYRLPENISFIGTEQLLNMSITTQQCVAILNRTLEENATLVTAEFANLLAKKEVEIQNKENIIRARKLCNINDTALIEGWERLANFEKEKLRVFSRLGDKPITIFEFADIAYPATADKTDATFFSSIILDDYVKAGFATAQCIDQYFASVNATRKLCYYTSTIIEPCLDRIPELEQIKSKGYSSGTFNTFMIESFIVVILFILAWLWKNAPIFVWR